MKKIYMAIFLLALIQGTYADNFECPTSIGTNQNLQNPVENWQENSIKANNNFARIFLTTNPAKSSSRLRADEELQLKGKSVEKYELQFYKESGMKIFVECTYFDTTVSLIREVHEKIERCDLEFESISGPTTKRSINCY